MHVGAMPSAAGTGGEDGRQTGNQQVEATERERERERDQHAHVSYPCKNFITITSDWQADAESCYGNKIILYAVWEMSF